jgi:hypothetical protein
MSFKNRMAVSLFAILLLIGFCLPWIGSFAKLNGWDIIFGDRIIRVSTNYKYILILVPTSGLIIFLMSLSNKNYNWISEMILWIPIVIIITLVTLVLLLTTKGTGFSNSIMKFLLKISGIGFWLCLIAALALPLQKTKKKRKFENTHNSIEENALLSIHD